MEPIKPESLRRDNIPAPNIPKEIQDTFSQRNTVNLNQAVLQARSQELRDRMVQTNGDPAIVHELGTVTFHLGGEREALALWALAHKKDANFSPADLMKEVQTFFALTEKGEKEKAKALLPEIEKRFAKEPHFQLIRAEQAMRGQNFEEAGRSYTKAHELGPKLYVTALNLGRYKDFMGEDSTQVQKLYETATRLSPEKAESWLLLGNLQVRLKQEKEALKSFAQLKKMAPSGPLPEKRLADAYLAEEDLMSAEKWYLAAIDRKPGAEEEALIHATLGDLLLRLKKLEAARSHIEKANSHKELPQLVFALGTIDEAQNKISDAEKRYRRVLEIMPGNPLALNNLAMLLVRDNRALQEALEMSDQARRSIPQNVIIESTYGCALSLNNKHAEAVDVLGPVLAADAKDAWARFCFGRSLSETERKEDAAAALKRLLQDYPDFERAEDVNKILKNIQ
ncbi:MAG: tetratricopeptide repeat protein [Desulfobacteraceae bacterium]|nr:tetratricopeptide repeat protein [Desulfobacteraceae bacterium]